jgi:UDP-galactopyranose mutase
MPAQPGDRCFTDTYQAMPTAYTRMFEKMLDHPNISAQHRYREGVDYSLQEMVFTGPVDEYFDFKFGNCPTARWVQARETLRTGKSRIARARG